MERSQHEADLKAVRSSSIGEEHRNNNVSYLEGKIAKIDEELAATAPTSERVAAAHASLHQCKSRYAKLNAQLNTRTGHYQKAEKKLAARRAALDAEASKVRKCRKEVA